MSSMVALVKKFRIHPLFWIVIILAVLTAQIKEFAVLFAVVLIHEFGHGVAATYFNWRITRIELLPFGGVAVTEEHGNKPILEEVIVILAGPLQHVWMLGVGYVLHAFGIVGGHLYELFMWNNIVIFCFNFLPIWPLDGGKLLFNVLTMRVPFVKAHLRTIYFSLIAVIIVFILAFLLQSFNTMIAVVVTFVGVSLYGEWKQHPYVFLRFLLERYYGKQDNVQKLKMLHVQKEDRLMDVFRQFWRGYKHGIVINDQERYDENELLYAYFSEKRVRESIEELFG